MKERVEGNARRVLVTGASMGIGRATVRRLACDGYRPIGVSRSRPDDLDAAAEYHCCDLADLDAARALIGEITRNEPLYGVVNNAAMAPTTSLDDVSPEEMDEAYRLDVLAPLVLTQGAVPGMRSRGAGRIVNLSSRAALGKVNRTAYSAAKSAIVGMTRTWALELAPHAITANVISPGPIDTESFHDAATHERPRADALMAAVPLKRMGTPEEVANLIAFLLGDLAGFITGETIYIDGGATVSVVKG
jgi:NAD(P)-dependent dehydrogenase (short-subunit alcohol dehydrogenase family)